VLGDSESPEVSGGLSESSGVEYQESSKVISFQMIYFSHIIHLSNDTDHVVR